LVFEKYLRRSTYQESTNKPEESAQKRESFEGLPARTISVMAVSIPIPSTEDTIAPDCSGMYPLIQDSERSEPACANQQVKRVVHEAPCEGNDPDETKNCRDNSPCFCEYETSAGTSA
jgi:hypothetical protein